MPLAPSLRRAAREADAVHEAARGDARLPVCLLMLPRPLESFILRDQADDLLRSPGVLAVDPPQLRYGILGRLPRLLAARIGVTQGRRLVRAMHRRGARIAAVTIFHPLQYPVALGVLAHEPGAELWYGRWDRYEHAYDAGPRLRERIAQLHELAAERSALTFVCSTELARLEAEAGRETALVPLAADSFPAPDPGAAVVAISLGHLGWRTDWTLLRTVAERMPELVLLLVGAWHDDEGRDDPDYAACRAAPNLVWLGERGDEEAARLILCADVGIVPFKVEPFNDAGLPYRILKYAKLGRRTVTPPLAGVATWANAVTVADDAEAFVAALRASAGTRTRPDAELREWALAQTAATQNAPLWERLRTLGIDG
jgi:glycosyltransferase involved in cell wall biosynthesis